MAFWSSELARKRLPADKLIVPYDKERVRHGAYELGLGAEAYVTSGGEKRKLKVNEHVTIPPGQFGLLHTHERVKVPADAIALISIKAGVKLKGLVNVSGFHVDPGFEGQLMFSVYNAGSRPVALACGEPTFLIWFCNLTDTTAHLYNGNHQGQSGISAKAVMEIQGDIASPQSLLERLQQAERRLADRVDESERKNGERIAALEHLTRIYTAVVGVVFAAVLVGVSVVVIQKWLEKSAPTDPAAQKSGPVPMRAPSLSPPKSP